ncbi:MAG: DUF5063 domain-containing protein [Bacteroidales bacterium]|nr:DUF5063 domain-containing protein [Bacteroidales bacterium]
MQENEIPNEPVYSKNVLEMLTVANEYCLFIEKVHKYSKEDTLQYLRKISPLLYIKGSLLPDLEPTNPETIQRFVTEENWEIIFNELRDKLADDDQYYFIDHSETSHNDPIKGSLADNYTDVYQDLKDFIMLYQQTSREAKENAVSECKELFKTHWGFRIVKGIKVLHYLTYQHKDDYSDL